MTNEPILNIEVNTDDLKNFGDSKSIITDELKKLFVRVLAVYDKTIKTSPWRVGMTGGGVPVKTGKLRDSHTKNITATFATIGPRTSYANTVHEGTSKREGRPWLEYAVSQNMRKVNELIDNAITEIKNRL